MTSLDALAEQFTALRGRLLALAYRLTGTRTDAEDAVQEAWLRLQALEPAERDGIRELAAWSTTVVSRICLDRLRSATARRESYVGPWLPEPIATPLDGPRQDDPLQLAVQGEDVRLAAMVVLDRLTPEQRVAFVLHDAFGVPFAEIAGVLGCSEATARQHASRGRRLLEQADPPPPAELAEQRQVIEQFMAALFAGDVDKMTALLHPDAMLVGDSNGKARTALRVMQGADKIIRFYRGLLRLYAPEAFTTAQPILVNGDLGVFLPPHPGRDEYRPLDPRLTVAVVRDGKIGAIYDLCNPDKLRSTGVL
ncbi:sigma-70 family RNA polymerase sigma factor [Thermocrispum municipale]|jgi:RNA polymerase sigma-70 factor (ECF subfamily)|uniref:sigma-70 family RNA polymerase sigma factor n=1 Tax=Thermocrispum municipale TaxID=37926 RepID=UPI0003FFF661|nr:sigma-70 family RNA polymerase sigma factor [Thermocrispum municipale]